MVDNRQIDPAAAVRAPTLSGLCTNHRDADEGGRTEFAHIPAREISDPIITVVTNIEVSLNVV